MPPISTHLAAAVRAAPGLHGKRDLRLLDRLPCALDGDDAALVPHGDGFLVLCGEAIVAAVRSRPTRSRAGAAAVVTNVADVRAMGGRPLALVDTLVSPDRAHAERVLDGLAWAAERLGVPVVGGHLTLGHAAGAVGLLHRHRDDAAARERRAPGRRAARARSAWTGGACGDDRADLHLAARPRPGEAARRTARRSWRSPSAGLCHAARDVSMPGVAGSLLQLIELAGCGAHARRRRAAAPRRRRARALAADLPQLRLRAGRRARARRGRVRRLRAARARLRAVRHASTTTRVLRLAGGGESAEVWDLAAEPLTRSD